MLWKFKKEMIATNRRQEESRERLPGRGGCGLSVEGRVRPVAPGGKGLPSRERSRSKAPGPQCPGCPQEKQ